MTIAEMCTFYIHKGYCGGAYKKESWCGNHTGKKEVHADHEKATRGAELHPVAESGFRL